MYAEYIKQLAAARPSPVAAKAKAVRKNPAVTPLVKAQPPETPASYLDRITVAGLHNYLCASGKYEKIAWNVTFLLAIAGTVYYLVPAVQEYLKFTIVLDIQHQTDHSFRLPNPWVCHEALNRTYIRKQFESVRPEMESDKRVQLIRQRFRSIYKLTKPVTMDELFIHVVQYVAVVPSQVDKSGPLELMQPQYAFDIIARAIGAMGSNWTGVKEYYEKGLFDCETIVLNCTLNGAPFNCCSHGSSGYSRDIGKCFILDIRPEAAGRNLQLNQTKPIELKLETLITHPNLENNALGAALTTVSFGNRQDAIFDYNLALQGGSESLITVRGTKRTKLSKCMGTYRYRSKARPPTHPLIAQYFLDMIDTDRYSVAACQMGKLFEALYITCGCVPYYDIMRPQEDTVICTPAHLYSCVYQAFQNDIRESITGTPGGGGSSAPPSAEDDAKRDLFRNIKDQMTAECLQLCESWTYDYTVSTSDMEDLEGNTSSINTTRITIVFDPEYRVETEVYKMGFHEFMASLGEGLGLILGCSIITLVQLPIWSIVAFALKRKRNKIAPMVKPKVARGQK